MRELRGAAFLEYDSMELSPLRGEEGVPGIGLGNSGGQGLKLRDRRELRGQGGRSLVFTGVGKQVEGRVLPGLAGSNAVWKHFPQKNGRIQVSTAKPFCILRRGRRSGKGEWGKGVRQIRTLGVHFSLREVNSGVEEKTRHRGGPLSDSDALL